MRKRSYWHYLLNYPFNRHIRPELVKSRHSQWISDLNVLWYIYNYMYDIYYVTNHELPWDWADITTLHQQAVYLSTLNAKMGHDIIKRLINRKFRTFTGNSLFKYNVDMSDPSVMFLSVYLTHNITLKLGPPWLPWCFNRRHPYHGFPCGKLFKNVTDKMWHYQFLFIVLTKLFKTFVTNFFIVLRLFRMWLQMCINDSLRFKV